MYHYPLLSRTSYKSPYCVSPRLNSHLETENTLANKFIPALIKKTSLKKKLRTLFSLHSESNNNNNNKQEIRKNKSKGVSSLSVFVKSKVLKV